MLRHTRAGGDLLALLNAVIPVAVFSEVHAARYAAEESRQEGGSCGCCEVQRCLIDQRQW
jgi:hypothetical protein